MEDNGMHNNNTIIKGIPVIQNQQEFIIGKVRIQDLLNFTIYTERVIIGYDENELPIYNKHVQRKVEPTRVNKIADFLTNDDDATFPTNIVLGIPIEAIQEQKRVGDTIEIVLLDRVYEEVDKLKNKRIDADVYITIIDGQHRIRGIEVAIINLEQKINKLKNETDSNVEINMLEKRLNDLFNIELVVSYFIDKSLEFQAMIFSTINRTQKRVSQDLVYSLFGLSTDDTPYKTALEVALALNSHGKSPFYKRIKLYGGNYKRGDSPPLSQSTMIKNIVSLISESMRESENDKYRKRKDLQKRTNDKFLPFRKYYANNNDNLISDSLFYFFSTVRKVFVKDNLSFWDYDGISTPQNILQSTVGFEALLKIMVDIIKFENILSFDNTTFLKYLEKANHIDISNVTLFPMSTKGKNILYTTLSLEIYQILPDVTLKDERLLYLKSLLE
jgi:DGQHR domain-containing protein